MCPARFALTSLVLVEDAIYRRRAVSFENGNQIASFYPFQCLTRFYFQAHDRNARFLFLDYSRHIRGVADGTISPTLFTCPCHRVP